MAASEAQLYRWKDVPHESVHALFSRQLIVGDQIMLAHVHLKQGCIVPLHHHVNEQLTYIFEGALQFRIGAEDTEPVVVHAGEVLHLPSLVPHAAVALEDTFSMDIFSPPRQDWLDKTDDYLRIPGHE